MQQNCIIIASMWQNCYFKIFCRSVHTLFNRVSELKKTNWGQNETLQSTAYPQPNSCGAQVFTQVCIVLIIRNE